MSVAGTVDFQQFETLFGPPLVRVLLDWDELRRRRTPVQVLAFDTMEALTNWHAPWYEDHDRREVDHATSPAPPLTFAQIAGRIDDPGTRWRRLRGVAADLAAMPPSVLVIATYDLGEAGHLVLDGNHRLAAIISRHLPGWRVAALAVQGPVSAAVLPDLRHFE